MQTEPTDERPSEMRRERIPLGRAAFLGTIAVGVVGVGALSAVGGIGAGSLAGRASGLMPGLDAIVPTSGWRIYNVQDPMPTFDPASYVLTVEGLVEQPVRLTWSEVQDLPMTTAVSDFHCVTGWSVPGVHWRGFTPAALMDLVRPRPDARHVTFRSLEEPYVDQLTLDQFRLPQVLLATEMDGAPLKRAHGAPLRLVIPQMYGYKGVKWVGSISFDAEPAPGYWETRGYAADAWVGTDAYR